MKRQSYISERLQDKQHKNNNNNIEREYFSTYNSTIVPDNNLFINSSQEALYTKKIFKRKKKSSIFTKSEDRLIINLVRKIGPKFNVISQQLQNKTLNMVKNRFYKVLRYQNLESTEQEDSKINIQESLDNTSFCPEIKEIMNKFLQDFQFFTLNV